MGKENILPLPIEGSLQAHTMVYDPAGAPYEVATGLLGTEDGDVRFETVVYKLKPMNDKLEAAEKVFLDALMVDDHWIRDIFTSEMFLHLSSNPYAAALAHDDAVVRLKEGRLVLIPPFERLALGFKDRLDGKDRRMGPGMQQPEC